MKCAVRDSRWITLKRPLAVPSSFFFFFFFFLQHYKPCPREASEICMLDCILDNKKRSLWGFQEDYYSIVAHLFRPNCAFGNQLKFPVLWLERSNHSCSPSISSQYTCLSLSGYLYAFLLFFWFSVLNWVPQTTRCAFILLWGNSKFC